MNTLSATALETFIKCPQQFAYKYQQSLWPHRPSAAALQGQLFHRALDYFVSQSLQQHTALPQHITLESISTFLNQPEIQKQMIQAGHDPMELTQNIHTLLSQHHHLEQLWHQTTAAEPAISEHKKSLTVEGITIPFEIRMDRIDRSPQGFWLIDYKTQATPPSWSALYNFELIQPWLYSLFAHEHYGEDFLGFVYFLPRLNLIRPVLLFSTQALDMVQDWIPQKQKLLTPQEVKDKLEALKLFLKACVGKIQAGNFSLTDPPLTHCRMCPYRIICKVLNP